ncbi:hypothetical protein G8759_29640 [Spirosoma aureum]|uniref:Uncharacterized protein n=1 Tax=Spirosoma aureum TaxID=2692134 RepID=A0A6G9AVX8_9BACT|nr:hypothetical protein [Spirosoma aureum]QIP16514.1 hypothetical protein G8759_29640 [Spirosoma aureum]
MKTYPRKNSIRQSVRIYFVTILILLMSFLSTPGRCQLLMSSSSPHIHWRTHQNPDAYAHNTQPVQLSNEPDFQVFLYPAKNRLLLKLLIGSRHGLYWKLQVKTDRNDILYSETKRTNWEWQLLNLQDLPEGNYRLVFSAGPYSTVHQFSIARADLLEVITSKTITF